MDWLEPLTDWGQKNEALIWWLFAGSIALLLLTPVAVSWAVVRLPADYFCEEHRGESAHRQKHAWWPIVVIAKNAVGIILLLAGLLMLIAPGQGLLTIVVGLMLIDFPGKYRLERWLATRPPVWRSLNWLRKRAQREPLKRPER